MNSTKTIGILTIVTALGLVSGCSQDDAPGATANGAAGSDSSSGNSGQIGNSQQTGKIAADGFYILFSEEPVGVMDEEMNFHQQEVEITAYADDINDLEDINGWTVSFKTEWGSFRDDKDSCVLKNGHCSVKWVSGSPASVPGSCQVAFTAWATGEEFFADINDNGRLDAGEAFYDTEEPFLDINENGVFDNIFTTEGVPELIDIANFNGRSGRDGVHNPGNGLYDGSFCGASNGASCSGLKSVVIQYRASLRIQEPFVDADDINGNGDTTEEINYCGPNPY